MSILLKIIFIKIKYFYKNPNYIRSNNIQKALKIKEQFNESSPVNHKANKSMKNSQAPPEIVANEYQISKLLCLFQFGLQKH